MEITDLPHLNVSLNGLTATLLAIGYVAIKNKRVTLHKTIMICALVTTSAFLTSYLIYHFNFGSKRYEGEGAWRTVYFTILISHVVLAAVNLPMVIVTATRAFRRQYVRHRRIARITFPIWMYVSVTGVIVYFMLY